MGKCENYMTLVKSQTQNKTKTAVDTKPRVDSGGPFILKVKERITCRLDQHAFGKGASPSTVHQPLDCGPWNAVDD